MITVIIPALNEEQTIEAVVRFSNSAPGVTQVIVVDDCSEDNTALIAAGAGAVVVTSMVRGKGISMKDGIKQAVNDIIVFLDADINPYPEETIKRLTTPLLLDEVDFVKGTFGRNAGRVTELVAKPLLSIFYPGLAGYTQPLSGMIAGRKQFFNKIDFFNDYGVDIGILLDMYLMKARIKEVDIGYIDNKSKPWEALGKMSKEVAKAIITRAQQQNPADVVRADMETIEAINLELHRAVQENLSEFRKMAIFDMDDTLLRGRFIDACARKFGFMARLEDLRQQESDPVILTKRIGLLLKGKTIDELLDVAQALELVPDVKTTVEELKNRGYIIGIISNSYTLITNLIARRIGADFSYANQLDIFEGKATGEVSIPSVFFASADSLCGHACCKTNALQAACEKYNVPLHNCIAVGDSKPDRCMVAHSGKGIAYRSDDQILRSIANASLTEESFSGVLAYAE